MKKQLWQLLNEFLLIFPSFTIKNETKKKFKNLLGINLVKYSSKFLYKETLNSYRHANKCSR